METLFKLAEISAHGILWFMAFLSVVSVSIMIERYSSLRRIARSSDGIARGLKKAIETQDLDQIEKLSREDASLEARALGYGLTFVKRHGAAGLDDLFNSFKVLERPALERNLNILGTIASNAPYV